MRRLHSPIRWFGGKGHMTAKLLPILNAIAHKHYAEPFGGGASVLMAKAPVSVEAHNDIDGGLYDFFATLRDDAAFERFYRVVATLPYSEQLYQECRRDWHTQTERHERVWRWYVVARQSFGGRFGASIGLARTASTRGMAESCTRWISALDMLPAIHERLQRVQIMNRDALDFIQTFDDPQTLFYIDPPYSVDTRAGGEYAHEIDDAYHARLVSVLLEIRGVAVLSCYDHAVYTPLAEAGWQKVQWKTACHVAGRTRSTGIVGRGAARRMQARTETVYISPRETALRQMEMFG
jgi:DNA adenine methylase